MQTNRKTGSQQLLRPQAPQAQCEHGRQKYKDLYGNPDEKLKKIIIRKKSQLKSLNVLPLWIASFLCGYFPDPTRFEPFFNFWVVNGGYNKIPKLERFGCKVQVAGCRLGLQIILLP